MKKKMFALTLGALTTALVLTGCSTPSGTPDEPSTVANDADLMFATSMKAHHEQAIEMADLVLGKEGLDPRVTELATAIKDAQGPEIDTMNSWIEAWGGAGAHAGMDHGMTGMLSEDDLATLGTATGPEASIRFLEQMIEHHLGAVEMAEELLASGENPDARKLATAIIEDQNAEIELMRDILATLG